MSRTLALAICLAAAAACSKKKEAAPAAAGSAAEPGSGTNATQRLTRRIQPTAPTRKPGSTETEPPGMPGAGSGSGSAAGGRAGSGAIKGPMASALHKRELVFDRDGDGQLSDQERRGMQLARSNALMRRLDANQDGKVNKAELEGSRFRGFLTSFELADADHDGVLTHPELGAAMDQSTRDRALQRIRQRAGSGAGSGTPSP